jgi:uncharacterized membrane protein SpoIIM required for sporulation
VTAILSGAQPAVNATRFRAAYQANWERLDALVTRIEKQSIKALNDDDLLALPSLYRAALSSLSLARATSLDRALIAYLEQLSTRAYFQLYGPPTSAWRAIGHFFVTGWPEAVRALGREMVAAALLLLVGTLAGYAIVRTDPSWFYAVIPQSLANGRDPTASFSTLFDSLYQPQNDMLATFAAALFTNNAQVAIFSFALGFAFAVPTAMLLVYNGLMLGALAAVFFAKGLGVGFVGWIVIHGTTELFAITLAGAAGFRIGTAIAFPGRASRMDAVVTAGRSAAIVMAGAVVMLAIAGLLEGIGRQTVLTDPRRYAIGAAMLVGWLVYFYLPRGRDALAKA